MKKQLTESERSERAARIKLLAAAAKAMEESGAVDIDKAAQVLGKYSRRNIAMILTQAAERGREIPQAVAGFHDWRKAGRVVRKGSKGYAIFGPVLKHDEDSGRDDVAGFAIRYVFDVADTDEMEAAQ